MCLLCFLWLRPSSHVTCNRETKEDVMTRWTPGIVFAGALLAMVGATSLMRAQQPAPDLILSNGKIVTVDHRFTIAQAVAIRGDRVVAVGANSDIVRLAG